MKPGRSNNACPSRGDGLKKRGERGVLACEPRHEFRPDLVSGAADGGAEHRHDAGAIGPQSFHGFHRALENSGKRAFPAGMARADDARLGVREQHGTAIGTEDGERNAWRARHHAVRLGTLARPWPLDDERVG